MNWSRFALRWLGRYEEADTTLKQMLVTDPLTTFGRFSYGYWLCVTGRVEEAHDMADQLLAESPRLGYRLHGETSYSWEGKIAEGLSWSLRESAADPAEPFDPIDRVRGFIWVGEYAEARRVDDELTYMVDVAEGRFDEAIRATQSSMQLFPHNIEAIAAAANVLYAAGRINEALPLYDRLRDFRPAGRPIPKSFEMGYLSNIMTMRLALARRKAGDEEGAQAAAQIARQDQAVRRVAGRKNQYEHRTEAMLAAFENSPEGVITGLESALQLGLRDPQVFDDPLFEALRDEPRFVGLRQELDAILSTEHDKVLQLICFNNPTPDNWRPLPETCEGVEQQLVL
jgi:tetratricopeptide (TPR) repeat protein